jgi:hypothetical protein
MFTRGYRHFYINEVAELDTGVKVMPIALIKRDGVLCADYYEVFPNPVSFSLQPFAHVC